MDSNDERRLDLAPVLVPMVLSSALAAYWAGNTWWAALGGAATAFLVWFGYTLTIGLTRMAKREFPAPPRDER